MDCDSNNNNPVPLEILLYDEYEEGKTNVKDIIEDLISTV